MASERGKRSSGARGQVGGVSHLDGQRAVRDAEVFMAYAGEEHPPPNDALELSWAGLQAQRADLRCVAMACDVRLPEEGSDVVRVDLEHEEGVALMVLLPHTKRRMRGIEYGELRAQAGQLRVVTA